MKRENITRGQPAAAITATTTTAVDDDLRRRWTAVGSGRKTAERGGAT
jgi:hypothetical protein